VHCHAGKNRTGFITSVYGMEVLDWDYEQARDNMTGRGHKPEKHQDMHDELKNIYESKKAGKSKT
jgi:protein tyrosine/serine phosphatase